MSTPRIPPQYVESAAPIPQLSIPGGTLQPGTKYTVVLTVTMREDVSKRTSAAYTIAVGMRDLVARIAGGSRMEASALSIIRLDASPSRDPDVGAKEPQGLAYAWSCSIAKARCMNVSGGVLNTLAGSSMLEIPGGVLAPTMADPYVFTVTTSKPGKAPSSYSLPVFLREESIPLASATLEGGEVMVDGTIRMNADDKVSNSYLSCAHPTRVKRESSAHVAQCIYTLMFHQLGGMFHT
jgi:hypothetical protein